MNTFTIFLFGIMFAATAGAAFAFMWKAMSTTLTEFDRPRPKRSVHPEMADVKSGEELLVFNVEEDDDDDGEIMVVRK
tara:strand:+ start:281 stop:514 length:234 start_codon:yes stop_codon:yes gene_type:complete